MLLVIVSFEEASISNGFIDEYYTDMYVDNVASEYPEGVDVEMYDEHVDVTVSLCPEGLDENIYGMWLDSLISFLKDEHEKIIVKLADELGRDKSSFIIYTYYEEAARSTLNHIIIDCGDCDPVEHVNIFLQSCKDYANKS